MKFKTNNTQCPNKPEKVKNKNFYASLVPMHLNFDAEAILPKRPAKEKKFLTLHENDRKALRLSGKKISSDSTVETALMASSSPFVFASFRLDDGIISNTYESISSNGTKKTFTEEEH